MAALHETCFDTAPRPWTAEEFGELIAREDTFICTCDVGFAVLRAAGGEAELLTVAVDERARRQGIAATLIAQAFDWARARGSEDVFLEVADGNAPARALYAELGFEQVGSRKDYYAGPRGQKMSALVMKYTL